nr:helix-turn-helix transcriptional regulator [Nitrolancea hollandica]
MSSHERREQLAEFLRTRRLQLQPEHLGLPQKRLRRTAGLRREEVAERADISVDWYTRLEQGRPINISASTLHRVADALLLTPCQCEYLFHLAQVEFSPAQSSTSEVVSPLLEHVVASQGNNPAYIINRRFDILATNPIALRVFIDHHRFPRSEQNLIWLMFTNPTIRERIVDWAIHAQNLVAGFRANFGHDPKDPRFLALIGALEERSGEFREWWARHDVGNVPITCKAVNHPLVGYLPLEQSVFAIPSSVDLSLILYTPLPDTDAAQKLAQLASLPPSVA